MKKFLSFALVLAMLVGVLPASTLAASYADTQSHWAAEAIAQWSSYGVVSGDTAGNFNPNASMTRAQMAQVICNLLGLTKAADISAYADMSETDWYANAIACCVEAGIMNGTSETTMDPTGTVTREQMFVILGRALGLQEVSQISSSLTDLHTVSSWASSMVNAMVAAGYIQGTDGKVNPSAAITRASAMSLLSQTITTYANEAGATVEAATSGVTLVVSQDVSISGNADTLIVAGEGSSASVSGYVSTLLIPACNGQVTVEGTVENLVISGTAVTVELGRHASVGSITIEEQAEGAQIITDETEAEIIAEGTVDEITWTLDSDGTLTFSGSGEMPYLNEENFGDYYEQIYYLVLEEGITCIRRCADCVNLRGVTIPSTVANIDNYTFDNCSSLTTVNISEGLVSIGDYAFRGCAMASIVLPDSLTTLGEYAFSGCQSLQAIVIPENVSSIGMCVFGWSHGLTSLMVAAENPYYCAVDNVLYTKDMKTLLYAANLVGEFVVPEGVTTIADYGISYCSDLTSIVVSEGVTSIGNKAFWNDYKVVSISLPSTLQELGAGIFGWCTDAVVTLSEDNPYLCLENGIIYTKDKSEIVQDIYEDWKVFAGPV